MIIDDLYRKYFDKEIPARLEWDKVKPGLKRKLFFRFIPTKFNIYYLLLIVSFSGYASYAIYRNFMMHKENLPILKKEINYRAATDTLKQVIEPVKVDSAIKKKDSYKITKQRKKVLIDKSDSAELKKDTVGVERMQFIYIKKNKTVKPSVVRMTDTSKRQNLNY